LLFSDSNIRESSNGNQNLESKTGSRHNQVNFSFFDREDGARKMREHRSG
jgi:hypothetical protein